MFNYSNSRKCNLYDIYKSFYFHHIGKTAGTSYGKLLRSEFIKKYIFPNYGPSISVLKSNLAKYKFFTGHFPYCFVDLLPKPCFQFTMLRNPQLVVLSSYNHLTRLSGNHISFSHRIGKPLTCFDDFLNDDVLRNNSTNPQCFSLGNPLTTPAFVTTLISIKSGDWKRPELPAARGLNLLMYGDRNQDKADQKLLVNAIDRLENQFVVAGIVERNDDTKLLLKQSSGMKLESSLSHSNVATSEKLTLADLSTSQQDTLHSMTELDQKLYQHADRLLTKRINLGLT